MLYPAELRAPAKTFYFTVLPTRARRIPSAAVPRRSVLQHYMYVFALEPRAAVQRDELDEKSDGGHRSL
jgi:hypothetical protein